MFGRRLPEGPVKIPDQRRLTLLQGAVLCSLFIHAIGLFGLSLTPAPPNVAAEDKARLWVVDLVPYRERGPVRPAGAAERPLVAQGGRRVGYAEGYVGRLTPAPRPVPEALPKQAPRRRQDPVMHDVPAPPPPVPQGVQVTQSTPSVAASSDPPDPPDKSTGASSSEPPQEPSPSPADEASVAGETPSPTPDAAPLADAAPTTAPLADAAPTAAPEPATPEDAPSSGLVQDPTADFSLILSYHNDDRIRRDASGTLELDISAISVLSDVKPVLAQNNPSVVPLRDAGRYGLRAMDRVKAKVRVHVDLDQALPQLVAPRKVEVVDLTVEGRALQAAECEALTSFIRQGVAATQWFPASSKGVWSEHSEQTFDVEVIQASDTAMSPPTSRAP